MKILQGIDKTQSLLNLFVFLQFHYQYRLTGTDKSLYNTNYQENIPSGLVYPMEDQ